MLKKIMMGVALAAVIGTPALAQSYNPSVGSGNLVPPPNATAPHSYRYSGGEAYSYGPIGYGVGVLRALDPFAYDAYAYEPAPYRHHHGRRGYRH